jgi:hypothetical protein
LQSSGPESWFTEAALSSCEMVLPATQPDNTHKQSRRLVKVFTAPIIRPAEMGASGTARNSVSGASYSQLSAGLEGRPEGIEDGFPETRLLKYGDVQAGRRNHFRLVNGDIGHGETLDNTPIAGDKARRPGLIVIRPGGDGLATVKQLGKILAVGDGGQESCQRRGIVELSRGTGDGCAHDPTIYHGAGASGRRLPRSGGNLPRSDRKTPCHGGRERQTSWHGSCFQSASAPIDVAIHPQGNPMNQSSKDSASRLASLDVSNLAREEMTNGAMRNRGENAAARAKSDCIPSVQAALNAFRQSLSLLDA